MKYATGVGAYLRLRGASFLGVYRNSVPSSTTTFLRSNKGIITQGYIFGPTSSISESVRTRLLNTIK